MAGTEATAGVKATLQWKCPEPESEIKEPNIVVPHIKCPDSKKKVIELQEGRDIQQGFVSLAAAGFAGTGSAGIGIRGDLQIGFDPTRKMFVIKAKAKATLGLGAGGAMEFSVSTENIWWFIRFVHAQLNDHNFSFLSFIETEAYERLTALSWELFKNGKILEAGVLKVGTEGMRMLTDVTEKYLDFWDESIKDETTADDLSDQILNNRLLLEYMNPEVKGRLLDKLCYSAWYSFNDDNKRKAILYVLNTISSQREFIETKERMTENPPRKDNPNYVNFKNSVFNDATMRLDEFFKGEYYKHYQTWQANLPQIAKRIIT